MECAVDEDEFVVNVLVISYEPKNKGRILQFYRDVLPFASQPLHMIAVLQLGGIHRK